MNDDSLVLVEKTRTLYSDRRFFYFFVKRFFDIFFSLLIFLPFLLFVFLVKILYLVMGDKGSIFYTHTRVGKNGKPFKLLKFRTMVPNSNEILKKMLRQKKYREEWREFHKFNNDPRITKVGRLLRKCSLDELPQILNILKGDMSIIGPRPLIEEEVLEYKNNKEKLLSVRPGLTGWWACNGRSCINNKQRMKLELYYVDHLSLWLDIKCFFLTIVKVLKREGAK